MRCLHHSSPQSSLVLLKDSGMCWLCYARRTSTCAGIWTLSASVSNRRKSRRRTRTIGADNSHSCRKHHIYALCVDKSQWVHCPSVRGPRRFLDYSRRPQSIFDILCLWCTTTLRLGWRSEHCPRRWRLLNNINSLAYGSALWRMANIVNSCESLVDRVLEKGLHFWYENEN